MKCPKCQTDNPQGNKFCHQCGIKLPLICPQCGSECLPEHEYCGDCGHRLVGPETIDYSSPQSYTPKHLANKILTTRSAIEGERKIVTVLFSSGENS